MSDDNRGRFVWYELLTTDSDAARDFYTKVVGWGTTIWKNDANDYVMWTVGEQPIGGVMKLPEEALAQGARPLWLPYVQVPDVDASNDQAVGLGAKSLVAPTDIPTIGRFAMLADPQGATFAIFKPEGDTPGPDGPTKPGQFSWHELATTDYEAALGFYSELFGWTKVESMDMGEAGIYQVYGRGGGGAPRWHVQQETGNAGTADVDALCERAERRRARRHDQGKRGTNTGRSDGSARRRPDHPALGSTGSGLRRILPETGIAACGPGPQDPGHIHTCPSPTCITS